MALSLSTSASCGTCSFCRKITPSRRTVTESGSRSWPRAGALVLGRSTGTPTVSSGAVTIKTIKSASITSTEGVTLISAIARRHGGQKTHGGGEQGLGDAGRHHGQGRVMAGGDGRETVHDAPHRAEQANKGRHRANRRQQPKLLFDAVGLAQDGRAHRLFDALFDAGQHGFAHPASGFEPAPPFAQAGDEHRCQGMIVAGAELLIKLVQRLAGPEHFLEPPRLALEAAENENLVEDDGPG